MSRTKTNKRDSNQKLWVRVLCIVLCALLAGGTIFSIFYYILQ